MELNENKIKEKLKNRRIPPSDRAWDKLEVKLDGQRTKPSRKGLWWIGIAASFLLGVLFSGLLFTSHSPKKPDAVAHGETKPFPVENAPENPVKIPKLLPLKQKSIALGTGLVSQRKKAGAAPIDSTKIAKARSIPVENKASTNSPEFNDKPQGTKGLNAVIASIVEKAKTQNQNHEVSDAEIDKLIREAQYRLKAESAFKTSKNTVNADVLLQEVEMEMDKSLKDRVFKALKDGLHKAKIMVASRDY